MDVARYCNGDRLGHTQKDMHMLGDTHSGNGGRINKRRDILTAETYTWKSIRMEEHSHRGYIHTLGHTLGGYRCAYLR